MCDESVCIRLIVIVLFTCESKRITKLGNCSCELLENVGINLYTGSKSVGDNRIIGCK